VRLADAHWERTDCKHTINGQPVHSVSCGDPERRIEHTSIAQEIWHAVRLSRRTHPDIESVYLASNMNCSDARVGVIGSMLAQRSVRLVCAQQQLQQHAAGDTFVASLVEQQLCARATGFIGSKYSTWTDTVRGLRTPQQRADTFSFEELWASGIR
jgi:hypothetical protein